MAYDQTTADLIRENRALAARVAELEADLAEQCRLLGAGSEREARLTARVAELEAALRPALHDALDLLTIGADSLRECSTRDEAGNDWTGEPEAQAEYERTLRTVEALKRAAALLSGKERS